MVEGDKWEMYIPSDLAYGDSGSPPKIPGGSVLKFIMEIVKINGPGKRVGNFGKLTVRREREQGIFWLLVEGTWSCVVEHDHDRSTRRERPCVQHDLLRGHNTKLLS